MRESEGPKIYKPLIMHTTRTYCTSPDCTRISLHLTLTRKYLKLTPYHQLATQYNYFSPLTTTKSIRQFYWRLCTVHSDSNKKNQRTDAVKKSSDTVIASSAEVKVQYMLISKIPTRVVFLKKAKVNQTRFARRDIGGEKDQIPYQQVQAGQYLHFTSNISEEEIN